MVSSLYALVSSWGEKEPDAVAFSAPGRTPLTYASLLCQMRNVTLRLNELGFGRNDRVAVLVPNGPESAVSFLAVSAGATCVPLNPTWRSNDYESYLAAAGAQALIIQAGLESPAVAAAQALGISVLELTPQFDQPAGVFSLTGEAVSRAPKTGWALPGDVVLVLPTSGTTSRPKIVPLTHANLCHSARNMAAGFGLSTNDVGLNIMPLFHIHGLTAALAAIGSGGSVFCTPGFYAPQFLAWLQASQATWYTAVPTMHQAILARCENKDTAVRHSLRFIRSCSAPLAPSVMAELERVFRVPVAESYGMTEGSHQIASNPLPPGQRKPGSVGLPTGVEMVVADEAGNRLPSGATGEVLVRGASITAGYENNPAANASAFASGWFRTGDQGHLDEDGYLFLTGRLKELINRGGAKISPREVDEALLNHPAVAQAVAFALPDLRLGEDIAAAVVLRDGSPATETELRAHAARRLADGKVPRRIFIVEEIPTGPTGKLQRKGLAEKLGLGENGRAKPSGECGQPVEPRTSIERILADLWVRVLGLASVGVHDDFFQSGGDSMLAAQLIACIAASTGVRLSWIDFYTSPTVATQAELIAGTRGLSLDKSCLVPLKPAGSKRPFFFIPPGAQLPSGFRDLAILVGPERPFYALAPFALVKDGAEYDIDTAAAKYLEEIRAVQPHGPYLLGGHCSGGFPALELARRLTLQGENVAFLVVVNPMNPERDSTFSSQWQTFSALSPAKKIPYVMEKTKRLGSVLRRKLGSASKDPIPPQVRGELPPDANQQINQRVYQTNRGGWKTQSQRSFSGKIDLWLAEGCVCPGMRPDTDPRVLWGKIASSGVHVHMVPGDHVSVLIPPHVQVIGELLRSRLDQID
jgi:acyl-CoA synthetase (AMP-forming)/AMP-acid ligase II/thioesterase domain-containing protein